MLISRVPEEGAGEGGDGPAEDHSHEYETASELFDLIAKNTFSRNSDPLTKGDLVILYKNLELGTRLMSETRARSNQRVESVVHAGDDPDSDASEVEAGDLAAADLYLVNDQRLDLLNNAPSLENTLCHKFGDLEIKMSNLGSDILFKTTTVNEQLPAGGLLPASCYSCSNELHGSVLPASLLDYICCKRLEDNYNFYMENIIRYVKHTIDQLKRISNGDYLTDKAKEKWREIVEDRIESEKNKKILAASASIPLLVQRKRTGRATTWDDIVHSEMDIRSLSKILEKKIFLEVPKIICGSYRLFSKQCADNLIISCEQKKNDKDSRVDVVLKLKKSQSGHVISNIDSIMILPAPPTLTCGPIIALPILNNEEDKSNKHKIVEILSNETAEAKHETETADADVDVEAIIEYEESLSFNLTQEPQSGEYDHEGKSDTSIPLGDIYNGREGHYCYQEAAFVTPDELSISIQRLDIQTSLPEESVEDIQEHHHAKKRSPQRVRIKSPYENKSHLIDEKKRKKLLEIRERREKKKIALSESCKIMKQRIGKGTLTPQASNSVTKLSITNKSFYNSIYGQACLNESKKAKGRKIKKDDDNTDVGHLDGEGDASFQSVDKGRKYANKTFYLDDAETEMMYLDMKKKANGLSASTSSALTADLAVNLSLLRSVTDFNDDNDTGTTDIFANAAGIISDKNNSVTSSHEDEIIEHEAKTSDHDIVPVNSPNRQSSSEQQELSDPTTNPTSTVECRKSIEKLYTLLKKAGKFEHVPKGSPVPFTPDLTTFRETSTVQASDSGTSLKHHLTSSETSTFSFNKPNNAAAPYEIKTQMLNRSTEATTTVVPKVIISTRVQTARHESEKHKKDHRRVGFAAPKVVPDNPLKAISQLLHEFDNAQKSRHKSSDDRPPRLAKKCEGTAAGDRSGRQGVPKGRSRLDQHLKTTDPGTTKTAGAVKRPPAPTEPARLLPNDKYYDRVAKKKMSEIIDEVKEARGEAVRGPVKTSRLNTLAQPKKSYVQAHSEDYQSRYGRNLMADRLQRLAAADRAAGPRRPRRFPDPTPPPVKPPAAPLIVIECQKQPRRSSSSSPDCKRGPDTNPPTNPPTHPRAGRDPARRTDLVNKLGHASDAPETLKDKMVAVESYVKNHYGRSGCASPVERVPKSRVPLFPIDIDLASMTLCAPYEESTAIGSELHHIIDTMIKRAPVLGALSEKVEDISTTEVEVEEITKDDERLLREDYDPTDVFEDNIHTAVEDYESKNETEVAESVDDVKSCDARPFSSSTELERLENALYRQMPIGNFQKRLRLKNLTITPKQSMQRVVVVQSGDAGSLVLEASMSQSFDLKDCSFSSLTEINKNILTSPHVGWRASPVPMQLATVGYAFPKYFSKSQPKISKVMTSLINTTDKERQKPIEPKKNVNYVKSCLTKDYTCQTFKGQLSNQSLDCCSTQGTSCGHGEPPGTLDKNVFNVPLVSTEQEDIIENHNKKRDSELADKRDTRLLLTENTGMVDPKTGKANSDDIEYSTSLDMLVGLLNEIQKITQTQVMNVTENTQCLQLETILNNAAALEKNPTESPDELVTISAIDKSRTLESSPSSYSFYISKSDHRYFNDQVRPSCTYVNGKEKPTHVDKEVSVDVAGKEYRNTFTDVPSSFFPFPITLNTSTSVTSSLANLLSGSSNQSLFSCKDMFLSESLTQKKILELDDDKSAVVTHDDKDEAITTMEACPKLSVATLEEVVEISRKSNVKKVEISRKSNVKKVECSLKNREVDVLKMKRDILVTVYSVLVLAVFAALSFPDVLYRA